MINKIKKIYQKEDFHPSLLSIFINPFYFIRKGLQKGISANAKYMKGLMLDFGCGTKPYKENFNVQEYIGLEIEKSTPNHQHKQIDVFYDGKHIPFDDNYFDSVFSSEVFEHIFNLDEILDELHRVMKPRAHMLVTLPFVWDEHEIPHDFARYTSFGIKHLLEKKGFEIIKFDKTTNYVETVFQMWNAYVSQFIIPSNKYVRLLLTPFAIFPVSLLGIVLSKLLPENKNFYNDNIIVARKIGN
ncbi:MAG: class I SAM-dependent methyltransferase [Bacteroidia bacterium]|nr:class I SAM-dependent methyltransferase [Bacteroidia bacterium]